MSGQLNNPPPSLPAPPPDDRKLLFEQYKLAVEMAQGISDRRSDSQQLLHSPHFRFRHSVFCARKGTNF
jgi:hypothetical protein